MLRSRICSWSEFVRDPNKLQGHICIVKKGTQNFLDTLLWAKDGTRTRDPNLGKVMLYQLSYFRNMSILKQILINKIIYQDLYPERDLNPHNCNSQRILSPSCLPFHHPGGLERKTGLEPATLTLARLCSTNWATFALLVCGCKGR